MRVKTGRGSVSKGFFFITDARTHYMHNPNQTPALAVLNKTPSPVCPRGVLSRAKSPAEQHTTARPVASFMEKPSRRGACATTALRPKHQLGRKQSLSLLVFALAHLVPVVVKYDRDGQSPLREVLAVLDALVALLAVAALLALEVGREVAVGDPRDSRRALRRT